MPQTSSDRQRVQEFKLLLLGRLREMMDFANDSDGPAVVVALGELTAEVACSFVGKQITLELLNKLTVQVRATDERDIWPPANENFQS